MVDTVAVILKETGLDPRCLELEITESLLMEDAETNFRMLSELKDTVSGLRIAIDYLETGYSSLYRLRTFPISLQDRPVLCSGHRD